MMDPTHFVRALKQRGFTWFTGVPCAFFQSVIQCVIDDPELRYVTVPNEGAALAMASGAHLAGQRVVVMIQNSGFGNLINPLTSLSMISGVPILLFVSGRGYGIADEPQHLIMGRAMGPMLDVIGLRYMDVPMDVAAYESALQEAVQRMEHDRLPFVFLIRKDTFESHPPRAAPSVRYPLKRIEAIRIIADALTGSEYVIATTGKPSRELFSICDRNQNFYMLGSMGHAASVGLGVSLSQPTKKVVILDGDGALLTHLGIVSTIGHYRPRNLYHIVLDNAAYETTGNQDTTSSTTDFCVVAKSCGYPVAEEAVTAHEVRTTLNRVLNGEGPAFLRIRINRLPALDIPRITTKYTSEQIAEMFHASLTGKCS